MNWFRLIIISVICGWLIIFLGRVVFNGFRSGRIAHTDSSSFCKKQENPLRYWALVVLFSIIIFGCIFAWGQVAHEIIRT